MRISKQTQGFSLNLVLERTPSCSLEEMVDAVHPICPQLSWASLSPIGSLLMTLFTSRMYFTRVSMWPYLCIRVSVSLCAWGVLSAREMRNVLLASPSSPQVCWIWQWRMWMHSMCFSPHAPLQRQMHNLHSPGISHFSQLNGLHQYINLNISKEVVKNETRPVLRIPRWGAFNIFTAFTPDRNRLCRQTTSHSKKKKKNTLSWRINNII